MTLLGLVVLARPLNVSGQASAGEWNLAPHARYSHHQTSSPRTLSADSAIAFAGRASTCARKRSLGPASQLALALSLAPKLEPQGAT